MGLFQHNTTKIWMGERNKCSMLIPPISREDETTKKGVAKVILSLLALFGIIEGQTIAGEYDSAYSFGSQHKMTAKVTQGMQQIIHVPGDLYGGCFHF
eukprot:12795314-Ditylum_brightwellii.AAC.1